jgi:hypothetical protein
VIERYPGLFLRREPEDCPDVACERLCGADDCTCAPCACQKCISRFDRARERLQARPDPRRRAQLSIDDVIGDAA